MKFRRYHNIILYTGSNSKLCELTRLYFSNNNYDYVDKNIEIDLDARKRMIDISGGKTTPPVVEIDDRVVVGYQPDMYDIILGSATEDISDEEK